MSTSLLYQAFGVRGYRHACTDYFEGTVMFITEQERATLRCPVCQSPNVTAHGSEPRVFRLVPIGSKRGHLFFPHPGFACCNVSPPHCPCTRTASWPTTTARFPPAPWKGPTRRSNL
jgi:zinc-finger of transposase IS204/IS1001/IS1096/IS1165